MGNLRAETISAISWSFLQSVVTRALQFVTGIILARLMLPEQFGLIGMLLIFTEVAKTSVQGGFDAALIQKRDATATDICSIFYFNIVVAILAVGILFVTAPYVAAFFSQPVLTPLLRVLSLTILIDSFGAIQATLFNKDINFKASTITSLVAGLLSGGLGISMALAGFGVWSLAFQQVALSVFTTASFWILSTWRPAAIFSLDSLRQMFGFGSKLLISGLLDQIFQNIYLPVIGRLFSAAELGLFTRANTLQSLPSLTLSSLVGKVTFPVFAKSQNDPERLKRGLRKALTGLVLLNFPIMVGLAVTARPVVMVLLGPKWEACIPYVQLLSMTGLLLPLHVMNLNLLVAKGRPDLFLRLEIIKKVLTAANIGIAWRWGIFGLIYGMIAVSVISFYLNSYYTRSLINYSVTEQVKDLLPYLIVSMIMGAGVTGVWLLGIESYLLLLLTQVILGIAVYVGLCWGLRLSAFCELWREACERIPFLKAGIPG